MEDCNPAMHTPMEKEVRLQLHRSSPSPPADAALSRSLVGMLRYLVRNQPDIAFMAGYVAGTRFHGCRCKEAKAKPKLHRSIQCSDADMGGDIDDSKSTSRMLFFYGSSPISWQPQKQF